MKSFVVCILICCNMLFGFPVVSQGNSVTETDTTSQEEVYENYVIYDEENNFLTEKRGVQLGDFIIDSNFNKYEIFFVDDITQTAKARFVEKIEKPKIRKTNIQEIASVASDKTLGLYSTHNDESYIIGDGTESVYGAGGIHDIAKLFAKNLKEKGVNVIHDETLHIPHNSSAYSRSRVTASNLLKSGADGIFDIHRDGASRSFYLASANNIKYSKVRIVVGQGNANKDANLQLALWMTSVAETLYPWLIADIYFGSGKYNQDLTSKSLLFEMGCHKIEKEYVENSVPALAEIVFTTLFCTTVNEAGDLVINTKQANSKVEETPSSEQPTAETPTVEQPKIEQPTVEEVLEAIDEKNANQSAVLWLVIGGSVIGLSIFGYTYYKKRKHKLGE